MKVKVLFMSAMMLCFSGMAAYTYAQDKPMASSTTPITKNDFNSAIAVFEKEGVSQANFGTINNMMKTAMSNNKKAYAIAQEEGNNKAIEAVFKAFRQQEASYKEIQKAFSSNPLDQEIIISQLKQFAETL